MEKDLESLVEAAAKGDGEAVNRLLEHYLVELRAFVRLRSGALLRERESHSDLVQSVCREVLERQDGFRYAGEAAFRRWLFTMAMRKIHDRRDYFLAQKRDVGRDLRGDAGSVSDEEALLDCYGSFLTPSRHANAREELARVEAAFAELRDEAREVITLVRILGLSSKEAAAEMGKSEGAIRVLLYRSLAKLSQILTESEAR